MATLLQHIPNLRLPTLGGAQLWNDRHITGDGWRVQQHVLSGHFRALDDRDRRVAWGSFDHCRSAVPKEKASTAETVLCVHGLGRARGSMEPMARFLRDAGYRVLNVGYASTRHSVSDHAETVATILRHGPFIPQLHWVGHSLGCLIARRFEAMTTSDPALPKLGRVVMLGPPNQGSRLARRVGQNLLFRMVDGPAGQEIIAFEELRPQLKTPACFGIIAGQFERFSNPLLTEPGDLVVTVDETKLDGASDFATVTHSHSLIMNRRDVMAMTLGFLRTCRFTDVAKSNL